MNKILVTIKRGNVIKKNKMWLPVLVVVILVVLIVPQIKQENIRQALIKNDTTKEIVQNKKQVQNIAKEINNKRTKSSLDEILQGTEKVNNLLIATDNKDNLTIYKNITTNKPIFILESSYNFIENNSDYEENKNKILEIMKYNKIDEGYLIFKQEYKTMVYLIRPKWNKRQIVELGEETIGDVEQELKREKSSKLLLPIPVWNLKK